MSTPNAPRLSQKAQEALSQMGLGEVYTNPMQSMVVRWGLALVISMIASKVLKLELSETQIQDYVELALVVIMALAMVWHRWRSTKKIMPIQEVAELFHENLVGIADRTVRHDVLKYLEHTNPKLFGHVQQLLEDFDEAGSQQAITQNPEIMRMAKQITSLSDAAQRHELLQSLKSVDESLYLSVVAAMQEPPAPVTSTPTPQ